MLQHYDTHIDSAHLDNHNGVCLTAKVSCNPCESDLSGTTLRNTVRAVPRTNGTDQGAPSMALVLSSTLGCGLAIAERLCGTSWRLQLNVGREHGSAMPPEWAASGARLSFSVDTEFGAEAAKSGTALHFTQPPHHEQGMCWIR